MDCNPGLHLLNSATGRLKRGYNYEGSIEWNMTNATDFPFDIQEVDIRFYTESNWSTPGGETTGLASKERQYCLQDVQEDVGEGTFWWQGWDGSIIEWHLHGYSACTTEKPPSRSGVLGTDVIVRLHISRDSYYYVSKLVFPLLTLAGMSFYSFALDFAWL